MNPTEERFQEIRGLVNKGDFLLAVGIVLVLGALIVPLPPFMIDLMLAFNIGVAMVVIMVSNFVERPLDFSVFPSLLLFTALLRIGMNVATTRKILLEGYAGEIINAFGNFVVGGNYIVGAIIFIILIVIQSKVIVAGASRISEVAARFTLDAMPGKQMTIDADLNSGLITEDEARYKREQLSKEADFYGAMDGAAKFVRGDVVAGMIITGVNILGGLLIGMFFKDMSFEDALTRYTLLTIGDGLVAQVPSLMISVASGIIVTRAGSSSESIGKELVGQMLIQPIATGVGAGVLFLAGLIPNMPLLPFWSMGALWMGAFFYVRSKKQIFAIEEEEREMEMAQQEQESKASPLDEYLYVDPISLEIGYGLIPLVDSSQGGEILDRIQDLRNNYKKSLGLILPPIRIQDAVELGSNEYIIKIKGNEVGRGEIMPESYLAMNDSGGEGSELVGIETTEPAFGFPATWVNEREKNRAEMLGYMVVDSVTVLMTHLSEIINRNADELLSRQDVQAIVDNLKKRYPAVVEDVVPAKITLAQVHRVLQNLLKEKVSIRNMVSIFEVIGDYAQTIKNMDYLTEYVRAYLKREISQSHALQDGKIYSITLDPYLEQELMNSVTHSEMGSVMVLDPEINKELLNQIRTSIQRVSESGVTPVIVVPPKLRLDFRRLLYREHLEIPVLSYAEISDNIIMQTVDVVRLDKSFETKKV